VATENTPPAELQITVVGLDLQCKFALWCPTAVKDRSVTSLM